MTGNQMDAFSEYADRSVSQGDVSYSLAQLVRWLSDGLIQIPTFQREYIWARDKAKKYVSTILGTANERPFGTICTYQINGKGTLWLADGRQRLETARRLMESPEEWGVTPQVAIRACEMFTVTLQHAHYSGHDRGLVWFQNVNSGTSAIPEEYFKGNLLCNPRGIAASVVAKMIDTMISPFVSARKKGREHEGILTRDSYALFLQYVSQSTRASFWDAGSRTVKGGVSPVEQELLLALQSHTVAEIESATRDFEELAAAVVRHVTFRARETSQGNKLFSPTILHAFIHLRIYVKNNGVPVQKFNDAVDKYIDWCAPFPSMTSRITIPYGDKVKTLTLQVASLESLLTAFKAAGIDMRHSRRKRRPEQARGLHYSHVLPHSVFGEGDVISEPAHINTARGARPIAP